MIIPKGWKLVPVEPTDDQLMAALRVQGDQINYDSVYVAMLAAAPTAPAGEAVTRCTAWCEEMGRCSAAESGEHDLCERRTMPTAPAGEPKHKPTPLHGPHGTIAYTADGHPASGSDHQPVSDPDGLGDRVLMPRALTAENGAKIALMGEFDFSVTMTCPECDPDDPNPDCEVCDGSVEYEQPHTVPWTTIKRIYAAAVDLLSAPAPDEREIAARAVHDAAQYAQDQIENQGAVTPESAAALDAVQAYANTLEGNS